MESLIVSIAMETLRVYRPRLVLHGPTGMGQGYLGAAALHHLEGYHVQTLDLGTLMGDSTRVSLSHLPGEFVLLIVLSDRGSCCSSTIC